MTVTSKDKEYWAKGTGFGTGSTSSAWDISAMITQNQSNELLVSLSLSILAEWLSIGRDGESKEKVDGEEKDEKKTNEDDEVAEDGETKGENKEEQNWK